MHFISGLTEKAMFALVATMLTPLLIVFKKRILSFLKKKEEKWYGRFLEGAAKKEKYRDLTTICYIAVIILCVFIFFSFIKFGDEFEKTEREFKAAKSLADSLYMRIEKNQLKTGDYDAEMADIKAAAKVDLKRTDSTLGIYSRALADTREYNRLSWLVTALKVALNIGGVIIWAIVIYVTWLFAIMGERIKLINEFEWGIRKKRRELTDQEISDLETDWANMKKYEDLKNIRQKLK
jgi:biopolymer transport protein ExbB/TolQ